jgi:hypothetical protein
MTRLPAILSAALSVSMAACVDDRKPIGQPVTAPLVTSQKDLVGSMSLFNSTDGLFVTASPAKGWTLKETRLAVSLSLDGLPHLHGGRCNPDGFLLRKTKPDATGTLTYALPLLVKPGTELFLALYAKAKPSTVPGKADDHHPGEDGDRGDCDDDSGVVTAWAAGQPFPGKDGSMYLTYTVRDNAPVTLKGQYRTYTQAEWGAAPDGKNPSSQLILNFPSYFPAGATIGAPGAFTAQFTTAQAVIDFLPQTGSPVSLPGSVVNPSDLGNSFAGDTLALTINLQFAQRDPSFSPATAPLGSLVVADPSSSLYGLPVQDVLGMANKLLCMPADPTSASFRDTADAVSRINANFDGGSADLGFLGMP